MVLEDLNKQWNILSSSQKEFKKSSINDKIDKILNTVVQENKETMPASLIEQHKQNSKDSENKLEGKTDHKTTLANLYELNLKGNSTNEKVSKGTQTKIETKSVGIQNQLDLDDSMKSDWVHLKKKQSKCMGKIEQMVKMINVMVTLDVTHKHVNPNQDSQNIEANLKNDHPNEKNLGVSQNKQQLLPEKENLSYSSDLDFEENLEKNFSFQSSEGRTSFTVETQNFTNTMNSDTKAGFSGGKHINKFKKS